MGDFKSKCCVKLVLGVGGCQFSAYLRNPVTYFLQYQIFQALRAFFFPLGDNRNLYPQTTEKVGGGREGVGRVGLEVGVMYVFLAFVSPQAEVTGPGEGS